MSEDLSQAVVSCWSATAVKVLNRWIIDSYSSMFIIYSIYVYFTLLLIYINLHRRIYVVIKTFCIEKKI